MSPNCQKAITLLLLLLFLLTPIPQAHAGAEDRGEVTLLLVGRVLTTQNNPVNEAEVEILVNGERPESPCGGMLQTDGEGFFFATLTLSETALEEGAVAVEISKPGFQTTRQGFARQEVACTGGQCYVRIPNILLPRSFSAAFILATAIFVVVFFLISLNLVHETIAALLGVAGMLGVSYFLGTSNPDLWIISFHRAITFIDFDVIFLLMTMMIFMALMSRTGIFQWMAFQTFRMARGSRFLVAAILILITGIISAVLNDTTVMLLMTPVSIQIALALNIHPAAIVVPEVLASNIGGAATLIGTPPNTIIGSYVGLSFNQFLGNMLPISVIGMTILLGMTRWIYREEFGGEQKEPSATLIAQLEKDARITDRKLLTQSLLLFAITLILFFIADAFHMPPAVVAMIGSTLLLLWVRPNVGEMLREVDWTTLVFFMALFMMVGGIQEVGLIQIIAGFVKDVAGGSLLMAVLLITWVSAISSAIVANIPFTAAIVPVTVYLTQTIPGAENNVIYWALALGAGLGGNATYIGSAPNIVAAGIMDRAGYRLTFGKFSRVGVPITFVTILVPTLWLFVRYFWLNF